MPYVTSAGGGMLTNFPTIRKAVKKWGQLIRWQLTEHSLTYQNAKSFRSPARGQNSKDPWQYNRSYTTSFSTFYS